MRILAGLGNPGERYEHTPHNVGFAVVDEMARRMSCALRRSFRFSARVGKTVLNGEDLLLVKPTTYMNGSGEAVAPIMRYRKAGPADLVVVLDDADLEFGRIRIKSKGSSGGHRGLASIIGALGTEDFARIRVGIGRAADGRELAEQVLRRYTDDEKERIGEVVGRAADAVLCLLTSGVEAAMNDFNAKNAERADKQ